MIGALAMRVPAVQYAMTEETKWTDERADELRLEIKRVRERLRISQESVAHTIGMGTSSYGNFERRFGRFWKPADTVLDKIERLADNWARLAPASRVPLVFQDSVREEEPEEDCLPDVLEDIRRAKRLGLKEEEKKLWQIDQQVAALEEEIKAVKDGYKSILQKIDSVERGEVPIKRRRQREEKPLDDY